MANKPRDDDHVTLTTIKDGAAVELFDAALEEVLKNIEDPNFKAKAKRGIRLDKRRRRVRGWLRRGRR